MSYEKSCDNYHHHDQSRLRLILYALLTLIILTAIIIFLVWAILKPTHPNITLQDITVSNFNLTESNTLSSTFQVTLISRNPNQKVGVYYQRLDVHASYRNQQITLATSLPATYEGHNDFNVWSPYLFGNDVPIAPFLATSLGEDLNTGRVLVNVKIDGRVKWKVGTWLSSEYRMHGNCPAYISVVTGGCQSRCSFFDAGSVKFLFQQRCIVDFALSS